MTLPFSPTEIRLFREDHYPPILAKRISDFLQGMNPVLPPTLSTNSPEDHSSAPNSCFFANIPAHNASSFRTPHRYLTNLTPILSELRPHCTARDHLHLWKPIFFRSLEHLIEEITDEDLDCLISVINSSWQPAMCETYRAGLLIFHVFCDLRLVPETFRCPADPLLMLTFISSCACSYSKKTLANYFYTVRAWHTLHGAPWRMNTTEMKAALDGAAILAPPSSKRPKRLPLTVLRFFFFSFTHVFLLSDCRFTPSLFHHPDRLRSMFHYHAFYLHMFTVRISTHAFHTCYIHAYLLFTYYMPCKHGSFIYKLSVGLAVSLASL